LPRKTEQFQFLLTNYKFDKSSNKAERQLQVLIYGILALNRLFTNFDKMKI